MATEAQGVELVDGFREFDDHAYPALEGVEWFGLLVPAGTSTEIVSGLNSAVGRALDVNGFKQSFEPKSCTPAEFAQLIKSDFEQWAATVKAIGFRPTD